MVIARGWGDRETGNYYFMGTEFLFEIRKVLEMWGGDGCMIIVNILNATELYT